MTAAARLSRLAAALAALVLVAGCAAGTGGGDATAERFAAGLAGALPEAVGDGAVCGLLQSAESGARRANFTLDFPGAERRLRAAQRLYVERPEAAAACGAALGPAGAQAELGLALSSQRKYRLADAAFAAAAAAPPAEDPARARLDAARLAAYRAQHDMNRARYADAGVQSGAAIALLGVASGGLATADEGGLFGLDPREFDRRLLDASSRYTQAAALQREGDAAGARSAIAGALAAAGDLPGATGAMRSRMQAEQAALELSDGDPALALALASEAAEQLAVELPGTSLAARARLIEAVALASLGRREAAFGAFDDAFAVYAETPAELRYESVWPAVKLALESEAAGLIDRAEMARRVFSATQLVRSAALASDIAANAALVAAGDDAAARAVRDWQAAELRVSQLNTAAARRDLAPFQREEVERELALAQAEEAGLRERRDALAPDYQRAIQAPVTLEAVQAALAPGEVLLQILVGEPRALVALVTPDDVEVYAPPIGPSLVRGAVGALRGATQPVGGGRVTAYPLSLANLVYARLFAPLSERIEGAELVFVVADGPVQALPLEILTTREQPDLGARAAETLDYTGAAWLGLETTFSYLPSARTLVDLRVGLAPSQATRGFLGFGDFDPGADPAAALDPSRREACGPEVAGLRRLGPLPGTAQELSLIGAVFGEDGRVLTGDAFTEGALRALSDSGELSDYRILHFATHGILWPTVDCFEPALTASAADDGFDGLIESGEIRALAIDADLVVLSACESVDPESTATGETLQGLTRAFLGGGARAAVASHWLVRDDLAPGLMADFYARLGEGLPVTAALRAAVAPLRDDPATSHPINWAPFVVFGDGSRVLGG